jgi:cyclohexanone monooxygenase
VSSAAKAIKPRSFDKDALVAKYRAERDKRLRADGNAQYTRLEKQGFVASADPYTPMKAREPKTDHVTFAFVGGGFAGLVTGARLVEAGIKDVRIIEKGGDFGGTWYWNRYPGAMCDTASMVYMPLLEETGHMPSEKYAHAPEILEQCQRIGRQFGLYDNALFHTEVVDIVWQQDKHAWLITTNRGDAFTAQFIGLGTGPLHIAKLPGIPGLETFKGHTFHTSRWDYAYTGGNPKGAPLDKLKDKRVAIIGTGATSVQAVPHLAGTCKPDRSRLVQRHRNTRLADALAGKLHRQPGRRRRARGLGAGRLDRPVAPYSRAHHDHPGRAAHAQGDVGRVGRFRFREDGGNPRPRRNRREGQGRGRETEGLVPPALQASVLPR